MVLFRLVFTRGFFFSGSAVSSWGGVEGAGSEGKGAVVSSVDGGEGGGAGGIVSRMDIIGFGLKAYPNIANIKPIAVKITVIPVASNVAGFGKYCGTAFKRTKPAIMKHTMARTYNP